MLDSRDDRGVSIVFQTRSDREHHPGTAIVTVTAHIYLEWTLLVPHIVRMLANKAPPSTRTHIYLAKRRWWSGVPYRIISPPNDEKPGYGPSRPLRPGPKLSSRQLLLWCSFNNPGSGSPLPGLPSLLPTYTKTKTWHFVVAGGVVGQNPGALTASNAEIVFLFSPRAIECLCSWLPCHAAAGLLHI